MEIIKNYLESMFANLPNTPEVMRAKDELWQMMEDKYDELISSGVNENEAVGTVISEFGNLDELADDLGIRTEIPQDDGSGNDAAAERTHVTLDDAKKYLQNRGHGAFLRALGIFFCIFSVASPIVGDAIFRPITQGDFMDAVFVTGMFVMIAIGVVLIVAGGMSGAKWSYIKEKPCYIDYATSNYLREEKERSAPGRTVMLCIGILLCIISVTPAIVLDEIQRFSNLPINMSGLGGAGLFAFVAVGVFLIVFSASLGGRYDTLLGLNDAATVSGTYRNDGDRASVTYDNKTLETVMSVYRPTVLCLYLIWSFLTFKWYITWIVWPVSAIIRRVIESNLGSKGKDVD